MSKLFKKALCAVLSVAMTAGMLVMPITASADEYTPLVSSDNVLKEWKLDFNEEGATPEDGFTLVTPDAYIAPEAASDYEYGFMGTNTDDYALTNRYDGWATQKGQVIELAAGNDAIGVVGAGGTEKEGGKGNDIFGNKADKYYPVRFAMKVPDETYYRVKATVTTLDPSKAAKVSLYTERKHPIYTDRTVAAGTKDTVTFSVRVTPLYYEKSDPKGTIADKVLSVGVIGENAALASLEIQQVETIPTFWILGDSTVTDGNCELPFFPLQNYTGYGTGFMKYLPRDMAMVNAGEGGLASGDVNHFGIVSSRIKEGDYLFFEYGHNESEASFKGNLDKYYNLTHDKKAKLIISSPAERINIWDDTAKKYKASCEGYQAVSEEFAAAKVKGGATDIACVGLSTASINFINKIVADNNNDQNAIRYYYRTTGGGATDTTHFNDAGAENIAYLFFEEAKKVTDATYKAVLKPILDNMTDETPNLVSKEITDKGFKSDAWPQYIVPTTEKYPTQINSIEFDADGKVVFASVSVRPAEISMDGKYGIVVITIKSADGTEKGKVYSTLQVDNSTGTGTQDLTEFTDDVVLEEGDTWSAQVVEAKRDADNKLVPVADGKVFSATYKVTDIAEQLLVNDRNDDKYENFDYVGASYNGETSFIGLNNNGWEANGSSGKDASLNEENGVKYGDISIDGAKTANGAVQAGQGSFTMAKPLAKEAKTSGRILVSADIRYVGGGGTTFNLTRDYTSKNIYGSDTQQLFSVEANGVVKVGSTEAGTVSAIGFTNVQAIVDCDLGTLEVTVEGNEPVTTELDNYKTTNLTVTPAKFTHFMFGGEKKEWHINVANLMVAKMKDKELPKYTAAVTATDNDHSTVTVERKLEKLGASMKYDEETESAVITAEAACTGKLIEAVYADGALTEIIPHDVALTASELTKSVPVTAGSKLMLWDSLNGMKPLAYAITAQTVEVDNKTVTERLNTPLTAHVAVDDGYVFMGWYDGTTLVSMEEGYSFRLRDDITLSAKIVPEPGVEDVANYSIAPVTAYIKGTAGASTSVNVLNPVDSAGTPIKRVTNSDVIWTSSDSNVPISGEGVVTVGEDFDMGSANTKTVTITGKLNDITKTCTITLHSYAYYEAMAKGVTNFNGTFMTIAGKTAIVFPGQNTTSTYTLSEPVALNKATTIKFDHVWSLSNTCLQNRTLNFKNSSGTTIFSMYYSWASLYVGKTELQNAVSKDSYSTVAVVVDPTAKTVTVTVGSDTATTTLEDNAGNLAAIDFNSASSAPGPDARALGISNLIITQ